MHVPAVSIVERQLHMPVTRITYLVCYLKMRSVIARIRTQETMTSSTEKKIEQVLMYTSNYLDFIIWIDTLRLPLRLSVGPSDHSQQY